MRTAKELLIDFIDASWRDPETMLKLFAPDGAIELPYLADFGYQSRYAGPEGITSFCNFLQDLYPGFTFENLKILIDTPEQVFAEYEFTAVSMLTRRTIHQLFFGRVVAKNGRITLVREALNTAEVARAIYARGIPDLPANEDNE